MPHDDLREAAVNAIANYMHHEIFDAAGVNMRPFCLAQAEALMRGINDAVAQSIKRIPDHLKPYIKGGSHAA